MDQNNKQEVLRKLLRVRMAQLIVNEMYKNGAFKVPIHLALGHEAIAVAVSTALKMSDQLVLNHRNIHYNLVRGNNFRAHVDEYLLKPAGLAQGQLGSMNLVNEEKGIIYSSSILGNNLSVAAGIGMANCVKQQDNVVFVVTGDGAMEEGAFYESLVFEKSNSIPTVVIIENNEWSLATKIDERRCPIDVKQLAGSVGVAYEYLSSNDVFEYIEKLSELRALALAQRSPVCVEVKLSTLGWWRQKTQDFPEGKFINYHAGPSPSVVRQQDPVLAESDEDPVHVLRKHFDGSMINTFAQDILITLEKELT